jgi:hypothetical protein
LKTGRHRFEKNSSIHSSNRLSNLRRSTEPSLFLSPRTRRPFARRMRRSAAISGCWIKFAH